MRLLSEADVGVGDRWVYSAGFNVEPHAAELARIECETDDLRFLLDRGARVALLTHQGSYRAGTARTDVEYLARRLSDLIGRPVGYVPTCVGPTAQLAAASLGPGEVAVFGNTRTHEGEEANHPQLAREFSSLGDRVAVGGFSKAHRSHASNVGILDHRPGYATRSLCSELDLLRPWTGSAAGDSVSIIGGVKDEKMFLGAQLGTQHYQLLIPGGLVLSAMLSAAGYQLGRSCLGGERWQEAAAQVLSSRSRSELHLPRRLVVADPLGRRRLVDVEMGVPPDASVVDFVVESWAIERIAAASRVLIAGTPGQASHGNRCAGAAVVRASGTDGRMLAVGGDTVEDLGFGGLRSTGGGAALEVIVNGSCAVVDALERNSGGRDAD